MILCSLIFKTEAEVIVMNLNNLLSSLKDCPCGREHTFTTKVVETGAGLTAKAGQLLLNAGFPQKILLVADENTLKASGSLRENLKACGFEIKEQIFTNLVYRSSARSGVPLDTPSWATCP
jgi:hypothetical protein